MATKNEPSTIRKMIITRLENLRTSENNFDKKTMRWSSPYWDELRDFKIHDLSDEKLLMIFEMVIIQLAQRF